ncbi:MAG: tetratricopeptide repeat protein [Bacteroidales bacterium]|nr:tetratricopeptide repeat protein [Bacteroidales bacterium]
MVFKIISKYTLLLILFFYYFYAFSYNNPKIDNLQKQLKSAEENQKAEIYNKLAIAYKGISPEKIIEYAKKALELSKTSGNKLIEANALLNIGMGYFHLGNYDKTLEYYLESSDIMDSIDNKNGSAECLIGLGNVYMQLNKLNKTLNYYKEALIIKTEIKDSIGIAAILNNIGVVYLELEDNKTAMEYHVKSLKIKEIIGDLIGTTYSLNNIGYTYFNLNDYNKSLDCYFRALKIRERIGSEKEIAVSLFNIGETYIILKNYNEALLYLERSLKLSKKSKSKYLTKSIYKIYSDLYENIENNTKALEYYKLYSTLKDSLYSEQSNKKIAELQVQFDLEKKQKEIELLTKDKDAEIKKRKLISYSFILGFILILLFTFLIYSRFRVKKKANILLEKKNLEINQQKEEIQAQAENLSEINEELEKLSIVASKTDNAIIIMDAEGNFEWLNDGFTNLYELTIDELINDFGKNITKATPNPNAKKLIKYCIENKETINYESYYVTKSQKKIWNQTTLTPILDEKGNIKKLIAIDTDISKLKKAEEKIFKQKEEITDSIIYAKRIQNALFPSKEIMNTTIPQYFVLDMPRGIVSGDFYWFSKIKDEIVISVADCTGHGVPGAFMSMLGVTFLNKIVNEKGIIKPNEILDRLRNNVITSLHQTGEAGEANDGMDIALINIDKKSNILEYAGANNSAYLIRNSELTEIFADKMPIGIYREIETPFSCQKISIQTGDMLYLFTDGYVDQFGGLRGRKFLYKNFKNLLKEIHKLPVSEQNNLLKDKLLEWRGKYEQIDDILIMGIKI